jgi:nucleoside permease NupC
LAANSDDFRVMWLTGLAVLTLLAGAAALGGARIPWRTIWTDFAIEVLLSAISLALVVLLGARSFFGV